MLPGGDYVRPEITLLDEVYRVTTLMRSAAAGNGGRRVDREEVKTYGLELLVIAERVVEEGYDSHANSKNMSDERGLCHDREVSHAQDGY